jgi:hypothetical protein
MQTVVSGSTVSESIKYVKVIQCSRDSVKSPVISSSGCWWNITFPQVRNHRVLNSLHKWNSKLKANKRKGRKEHLLRKNLERSHTSEGTENSLEHWISFTYFIDSETVEPETTVCIIH